MMIVLWSLGISASLMSTLVITLDRLIYIVHGIRYARISTPSRIKLAIICAWIIPAIMSGFAWWNFEVGNPYYRRKKPALTFIISKHRQRIMYLIKGLTYHSHQLMYELVLEWATRNSKTRLNTSLMIWILYKFEL